MSFAFSFLFVRLSVGLPTLSNDCEVTFRLFLFVINLRRGRGNGICASLFCPALFASTKLGPRAADSVPEMRSMPSNIDAADSVVSMWPDSQSLTYSLSLSHSDLTDCQSVCMCL